MSVNGLAPSSLMIPLYLLNHMKRSPCQDQSDGIHNNKDVGIVVSLRVLFRCPEKHPSPEGTNADGRPRRGIRYIKSYVSFIRMLRKIMNSARYRASIFSGVRSIGRCMGVSQGLPLGREQHASIETPSASHKMTLKAVVTTTRTAPGSQATLPTHKRTPAFCRRRPLLSTRRGLAKFVSKERSTIGAKITAEKMGRQKHYIHSSTHNNPTPYFRQGNNYDTERHTHTCTPGWSPASRWWPTPPGRGRPAPRS